MILVDTYCTKALGSQYTAAETQATGWTKNFTLYVDVMEILTLRVEEEVQPR